MSDALNDVLDTQRDEERRKAVRALLRSPLLTPRGRQAAEYALVRRHAGVLAEWFARETGWSLHTDSGVARLRKTPGRLDDGSRAATARSKGPFSRRRYVLACLALAALERSESQVTLGWLVDRVMAFAQDEELTGAGIVFALDKRDERADLVAVAQLLLEIGVLVKVAGDEQSFVNRSGDALYDVDRRVLSVLLATRRGPSMVAAAQDGPQDRPQEILRDRLRAITEELTPDTGDGRNRQIRHTISRRLLDDPVLYYADLTTDERTYLERQRGPLLKRLTEATGFVAEVRAEGIALLDPTREATDLGMPDEGTDGHATLLLAEFLSDRLRAGLDTVGVEAAEQHMKKLIGAHKAHWRKSAKDPGAERELTALALRRLAALGLIALSGQTVRPLPALARFGYAPAKITGKNRV
ncbi:TIGR02678 family protein [Actinomadura alba]|uniref:TIGR02678 family protein n=1 Tax=Actinomadura alba TaxID=406431 RepID=A0ABR7LPF5_9ACTN|nr:TIGR02678 family protein [Actinomadura alba]MBC6466733.1 TIGR02678 family protein [Actinomadura alba]